MPSGFSISNNRRLARADERIGKRRARRRQRGGGGWKKNCTLSEMQQRVSFRLLLFFAELFFFFFHPSYTIFLKTKRRKKFVSSNPSCPKYIIRFFEIKSSKLVTAEGKKMSLSGNLLFFFFVLNRILPWRVNPHFVNQLERANCDESAKEEDEELSNSLLRPLYSRTIYSV